MKNPWCKTFFLVMAIVFTAGCCTSLMRSATELEHSRLGRWADNSANVKHLMHSTVAIVHPFSGRKNCTGFFISPDTIMTARHCLDMEAKTEEDLILAHSMLMNMELVIVRYDDYINPATEIVSVGVTIVLMPKTITDNKHKTGDHDVMLLQLKPGVTLSRHWLPISDTLPELGSRVYGVALPKGQPWFFGEGVVQQYYYDRENWPRVRMIGMGMHVNHGSSGSPAVNNKGEVVGMAQRMGENMFDCAYIPPVILKEYAYGWLGK